MEHLQANCMPKIQMRETLLKGCQFCQFFPAYELIRTLISHMILPRVFCKLAQTFTWCIVSVMLMLFQMSVQPLSTRNTPEVVKVKVS